MINRKIWRGDLLRLSAGNSFYGHHDVVTHREGFASVSSDSEVGDPLVEIDGGMYLVKRSDLHELNDREVNIARLVGQLSIPEALNGIGHEERLAMVVEYRELLETPAEG